MRMAVMGAGLQGVGIALEAARRGVTVDLFEKRDTCLAAASLHNEGKVHLGFVYANDRSLQTARLMATAGLHFERIVAGWLGLDTLGLGPSRPFHYVVHPRSMLSIDELSSYWAAVTHLCGEVWSGGDASYFGGDPRVAVRRCRGGETTVFETPEVAIDPATLAARLRTRVVDEPAIRLRTGTAVEGVRTGGDGVAITFTGRDGPGLETFDHVVNACWDGLVALDQTAGLRPPADWSFRLKRFLRVRAPELADIESSTIVLGPFGDVVNYGDGEVYLCWYPAACRGVFHEVRHPPWQERLGADEESALKGAIVEGLCGVLPDLHRLSVPSIERGVLGGGIIYALGNTGIEDSGSLLHQRHATGPRSFGRYHSVDTGKWTTAPWFARRLVADLLGAA